MLAPNPKLTQTLLPSPVIPMYDPASRPSNPTFSHRSAPLPELPAKHSDLTPTETIEFTQHAKDLVKHPSSSIPSNPGIISASSLYLKGAYEGSPSQLRCYLQHFRDREHQWKRAQGFASALGWYQATKAIGGVADNTNFQQFDEAESRGCMVGELLIHDTTGQWREAAVWLYKVWKATGKPVVSQKRWNAARPCACTSIRSALKFVRSSSCIIV